MLIRSYNLLLQLSKDSAVDLIALAREDTMKGMYSSFDEGLEEAFVALSGSCQNVEFIDTKIGNSKLWTFYTALIGYLMSPPYSIRWFKSNRFRKAVQRSLSSTAYDLIVVDTISLAPYVLGNKRCAMILDHHNIESDMFLRRADKEPNWFKRQYFRQEGRRLADYEREVCKQFDLHITCSELDSKRLKQIDSSLQVEEVPNGVDIKYFSAATTAPKKPSSGLIFVGGQGWYPNRDAVEFFAKDIWPTLREKNSEITFDLIGRGPSMYVREVAEADSRFRIHGFVDDIRAYVSAAAIYVCPIRDGGGTKLKILDALAMGKAIVAHPLAVEGIDVEDGITVLLASTPEEFVNKIEELLADERLRSSLELNARQLAVDGYSYDSIGESFRSLVEAQVSHYETTGSTVCGRQS